MEEGGGGWRREGEGMERGREGGRDFERESVWRKLGIVDPNLYSFRVY